MINLNVKIMKLKNLHLIWDLIKVKRIVKLEIGFLLWIILRMMKNVGNNFYKISLITLNKNVFI